MSDRPRKTTSKTPGEMLRGDLKVKSIPVEVKSESNRRLPKPEWIRAKFPGGKEVLRLKKALRDNKLHTVCEEANCPNLGECFGKGTATFMIMGAICTRRCAFCDVAHGRPLPLDNDEPMNMAKTIADMQLKYVVITSVDRDDLRDGGAQHFVDCIKATRELNDGIIIEILTPDFRGRMEKALEIMDAALPDVFNHNLETVPELYKGVRPGSSYQHSLDLLKRFKERNPHIDTKSGLMLGLGESIEQVESVMADMKEHKIDCLTFGQYLQPSRHHYPVQRYVTPAEFQHLKELGDKMGFKHTASGPMVRSSYHADLQHSGEL